jgi:hypothetical protein
MKRLPKIRSGLARLRMFRSTVRLGMMGSTVLTIILWTLAVAFLLDFWIQMGQLERFIVLVAVLTVMIWAFAKFLAPVMKVSESDTALAVMVDNMHGMHSDLVGAIQFADDDRPQYGSERLREAVVENTGETAGTMNFLEGFSRKEMFQRIGIFAATALICLGPAVAFGNYTGTFLKRMLLFDARYPTRTKLEVIRPELDKGHAEGDAVTFEVHATHVGGPEELPESGEVRVIAEKTGLEAVVELTRESKKGVVPAVYSGTLNRVLDNLAYTVYLGDDRSDIRQLRIVPRPRVTLEMKVITPEYVRGKVPQKSKNQRQTIAVEGSKIIPTVTCDNKELKEGTITFEKSDAKFDMTLRDGKLVFEGQDSPLSNISEMVRFEINVTDTNNQEPESPIKGLVHIAADLPPRAALMGFSRYIVPGAAPELRYKALDDYALGDIVLHLAVIDADGSETRKPPITLAKVAGKFPGYQGSYTLNVANLKLQKGYQISAFIDVTDYRGKLEGKSRRSEKWIFEVTDNAGVLEAMDRLTEQMDKKLDEILRAQLEAGK